jgi:DNA-binding transcriptional LysR family regulator
MNLKWTLPVLLVTLTRLRKCPLPEESLGIALFDRIGRDVHLTPTGRTLLEYARQIEALTNDALAALSPFGGNKASS